MPSTGLPAGQFRTIVSCFHSQTASPSGGPYWDYTCSGWPRVATENPFYLQTWKDTGSSLQVIENVSVTFSGTPAAFINSSSSASIYNRL